MNKQKYEIYVDMDGVIFPLDRVIIDHYNKDYNANYNWEDNRTYWWEDTGAPRSYFAEVLQRPGIFFDAEPMGDCVEYINKLHNEGYEINILTAPQWNRTCIYEKIEWIKKYFPFIDVKKNVHFSGSKYKFAKNNAVLIDDNDYYLTPWEEHGGISVAFKHYGWGMKTKNRVENFKEFYDFIHSLK